MHGKVKDNTGVVFGELTGVKPLGFGEYNRMMWQMHCSCGKDVVFSNYDLTTRKVRSCGHDVSTDGRSRKTINHKGQRFGKLTVVSQAPRAIYSSGAQWLCRCDCGVETSVAGHSLRRGLTVSCATAGCSERIKRLKADLPPG